MSDLWQHRIAPSADSPEAAVRPMGWEEAQAWCNFVVMRPGELPSGLALTRAEMRPEAPPGRGGATSEKDRPTWTRSNRACYRFELEGEGRRIRIKEFLYDWAPPAFDCPCLWRSQSRPFPVGEHVGWIGTDFRKLPGASVHLNRTMVELSVTEGSASDEEIQAILRGLQVAVPAACRPILDTPLGDLCYQRRHPEPIITVPVGFWSHRRQPLKTRTKVYGPGDEIVATLPGSRISPHAEYEYRLDTVFVYGNPADPREVEFVYYHAGDRGRYVYVLASRDGTSGGVAYPPVLDEQPCSSRTLEVRGRAFHHAFCDERVGPHEAVWQEEGLNVMLLTKPAPWSDARWFVEFLGRLS